MPETIPVTTLESAFGSFRIRVVGFVTQPSRPADGVDSDDWVTSGLFVALVFGLEDGDELPQAVSKIINKEIKINRFILWFIIRKILHLEQDKSLISCFR